MADAVRRDSAGDELQTYLDRLLASVEKQLEDVPIERRFEASDSGGRLPGNELLRYRGMFREREPDLSKLLTLSRVVILGEPGAGKSTIAALAARRLVEGRDRNAVPVLVSLKSYRGDLQALLAQACTPNILQDTNICRVYLFDGLDEIESSWRNSFADHLERLNATEQDSKILLTSRQAFFAEYHSLVRFPVAVFHLLDFSDDDIRTYLSVRGLDADKFLKAVRDVECPDEIRNPLVLKVMVTRYEEQQRFSALKSDNICFMVDELLRRRHAEWPSRYRRAIRMIAVGMEACSRNELSLDEAQQVISASMGLSGQEAAEIVNSLLNSVLVRTETGVSFQMRSYGEYLAAEELQNQSFDHIRRLAFFEDGQPNDSWMNTIAYLAELNSSVRRHFALNYPYWLLRSSPAAFDNGDRRSIVESCLKTLDQQAAYLADHPLIRPWALAKFMTEETIELLRRDLNSDRPHRQANALLLLGIRRDPAVLPVALPIALAKTRNDPIRYSAILALQNAGPPDLIDRILPVLDANDPLYTELADCLGTLCSAADIERVLPALLAADTYLSSTFYHLQELRSREALVATLKVLIARSERLNIIRIEGYIKPILKLLPEHQDDEIVNLCVQLLVAIEQARVYPERNGVWPLMCGVLIQSARKGEICLGVLRDLLANHTAPRLTGDLLAEMLDQTTAQWLIEEGTTELIRDLASSLAPGKIRDMLAPYSGGFIPAQDKYRQQYREQEQRRETAEQTEIAKRLGQIHQSHDFNQALGAFTAVEEDHWPDLAPDRLKWLADRISECLVGMELEKRIVYLQENSWQQPVALKPVLQLIDRYGVEVKDDRPLVLALKAWPERAVSNYYKRHGFSREAKEQLEALLLDRSLNPTFTDHLLAFLRETIYDSQRVRMALEAIAKDANLREYARTNALDLLANRGGSDGLFEELAGENDQAIAKMASGILVDRQHRATIERALGRLLLNEAEIRAGEVPMFERSPLEWIGKVRSDFAWDKLKELRRKTLQLNLPTLAGRVTDTMVRIDRARLARVVREQLQFAPEGWKRTQFVRAMEYEKEARLLAAQATPFERVVQKLQATTSMLALKVWCEGANDRPVFKRFLRLMGLDQVAETLDFVGGWPQLLNKEPARLRDGYREAIVVMDGDRGRHLRKENKPETNEAKKARRRLGSAGVSLHVLKRYGIENYFSQSALQQVLGRDLSSYFPIPCWMPLGKHFVEPGNPLQMSILWLGRLLRRPWGGRSFYSKSEPRHQRIADLMTIADIEGTDLYEVLSDIKERAARLTEI